MMKDENERKLARAKAREWAKKQMEHARTGRYPEPRHDAELLTLLEMEERAKALKRYR